MMTFYFRHDKDPRLTTLKPNLPYSSSREEIGRVLVDGRPEYKGKNDNQPVGSLEDIFYNPAGTGDKLQESSVRRCRSFVTDDDISSCPDICLATKPRRSQLIPRAKLINRNELKDR